MSRKISLHLISSPRMSEKKELSTIRFPKRAREHFGFSDNQVALGKGEYQVDLNVKIAYKEDVQRLARMISQGKVTEEQASCAGFVSKTVQDRIRRKKGDSPWVSVGPGPITVGADPEFGLIHDDGTLRTGNTILPHAGSFGSDGPGAEVRPDPSRDHVQMVRNISSILHNPPEGATAYKWMGGATFQDPNRDYWFGGHIHLGRPEKIGSDVAHLIYPKIAKVLDHLVALPLVRLDTPQPHLRRNGCKYGYGKAGRCNASDASASIRVAPEGNRFEYRVLSGLWLTHPALARVIVGTTKAIAETAYGRVEAKGNDQDWANAPASRKGLLSSFGLKGIREVESIINNSQVDAISDDTLKVWERQLRNLDSYEDYAPEIDAFISLVRGAEVEDFGLDLKDNWLEGKSLLPSGDSKLRKALEPVEAI
jgi:hypothetical protein